MTKKYYNNSLTQILTKKYELWNVCEAFCFSNLSYYEELWKFYPDSNRNFKTSRLPKLQFELIYSEKKFYGRFAKRFNEVRILTNLTNWNKIDVW